VGEGVFHLFVRFDSPTFRQMPLLNKCAIAKSKIWILGLNCRRGAMSLEDRHGVSIGVVVEAGVESIS
jgi:hypothetical protein